MAIITDTRGQLEISRSAEGLVVTKVTGYLSAKLGAVIVDEMKKALAEAGRVSVANDWYEMTNYDGDVRSAMTNFSLTNRKAMGSLCVLVKSPMVNMGVNTAAIALKAAGLELKSTTNPEVFRNQVLGMSKKAA